ncbi:hypothetical protein TCAL_11906 [Tigriopus californicus]|uniref:Cyclin-like domain-containing protein n=1 Tax=Tigriopus californicus TaxID=6832 RepID=A0A553PJM5_TIGCA|nr:cyclin-K-like [Tigriopus californicus]TRY77859.1 hypothetical protein TCAL_11906 [Tigriopus californicus]|eukprot:TCALIF_11906-PA protein Name:"Similar to Ccnk Cyclin-K (Mus musculus)" AED:0.03 eAED:0.03 QI:73/1/1/1/1/1/3/52/439
MPQWYWDKKELRHTPTQLGSGFLDYDDEQRYRREGVRFIIEVGKALNLSHTTMASGAVYFHRFYMFHSFQEFPKYVVATCCLFLAGKAEETPKKCRDLIKVVRAHTNDTQFATFGHDPREEVMIMERVLLQTIKFDLQVDHPYISILQYAKSLKGDSAKLQKMVQMSWTFVNDSLCSTLCLQWEPEIIAIAVMYLAAKLSKFEIKDWLDRHEYQKHWWERYVVDLDVTDLEDICHQVLDLYSQPTKPTREQSASPPPGQRTQPAKPTVPPTLQTQSSGSGKHTTPPPPRENPPLPPRDMATSIGAPQPQQPLSRPQTPPPPPPPGAPIAAPPVPPLGIPPGSAYMGYGAALPPGLPGVPSSYHAPPPGVHGYVAPGQAPVGGGIPPLFSQGNGPTVGYSQPPGGGYTGYPPRGQHPPGPQGQYYPPVPPGNFRPDHRRY